MQNRSNWFVFAVFNWKVRTRKSEVALLGHRSSPYPNDHGVLEWIACRQLFGKPSCYYPHGHFLCLLYFWYNNSRTSGSKHNLVKREVSVMHFDFMGHLSTSTTNTPIWCTNSTIICGFPCGFPGWVLLRWVIVVIPCHWWFAKLTKITILLILVQIIFHNQQRINVVHATNDSTQTSNGKLSHQCFVQSTNKIL